MGGIVFRENKRRDCADRIHRRKFFVSLRIPIETRKFSNGLRVVVSEEHSAPLVTVGVYYNIGFRLEPQGRSGFAHLFEHMMFQGSENAGKMVHIQLINASGGMLNGSTHYDLTNYFESVPSNAMERMLWLEADRMRALKVDDENLRNQRDVVKEEVRVNVLNQPYGGFPWLDILRWRFGIGRTRTIFTAILRIWMRLRSQMSRLFSGRTTRHRMRCWLFWAMWLRRKRLRPRRNISRAFRLRPLRLRRILASRRKRKSGAVSLRKNLGRCLRFRLGIALRPGARRIGSG
jgi:hypothetical protein